MRAMVLKKTGQVKTLPLELCEEPLPSPRKGEILIRVRACGVCHTDLHTVEGELKGVRLPVVPGHQVVGVVEAAGPGVRRFKKGQRVGVAWLYRACGRCSFCRRGRENLCRDAQFTGYDQNGGYAEYMVAPEKFAYRIPAVFSDEEAAPLLCAGIIGFRALRLSGVRKGERLGLYGFGASAHLTLQAARYRGCKVYVFSRSEAHRALARELGAVWAGSAEETPPEKMNGSIIFAPAGPLVLPALKALERGGSLVLAGIYMTPIPEIDYEEYLYQERILRSVANATRQDGEEWLRLAARVPVKTVTKVYRLEEANRALLDLKEGRINGAGVLKI